MQLFAHYSVLSYTKIFLWTKHTCVHLHKSVCIYVYMYAPLPVCWVGRGAVELVSRSYVLTNSVGEFYDCFSEWRLKRRQKKLV